MIKRVLCAAALACAAVVPAQAATQVYDFTATVDSLFKDVFLSVSSGASWQSGVSVALGDHITGQLTFTDTGGSYGLLKVPGSSSVEFSFDGKSLSSSFSNGSNNVINNLLHTDTVTFSSIGLPQSTILSFVDTTGTAVNSRQLPSALSLSDFPLSSLSTTYTANHHLFTLGASLNSLTAVSPVPEADPAAMMLGAFGLMGGIAAWRRRQRG